MTFQQKTNKVYVVTFTFTINNNKRKQNRENYNLFFLINEVHDSKNLFIVR